MVEPNLTIHLHGIETCRIDQAAHFQGVAWRCGVVSAGWLTQLTLGYDIRCLKEADAGYMAIFARCYLPSGEDIAKLALQQGLALAAREEGRPIESNYGRIEEEARTNRIGIWSSSFVHNGVLYRGGGT